MRKAARLSKIGVGVLAAVFALAPFSGSAEEIKKIETGQYRDIFLQGMYYEVTNFLHLDRLYRAVTGKKAGALDINAFDEVPDNPFFTNRHGRTRLSSEELTRGYFEGSVPDLSRPFTVIRGKYEGTFPGFFIRDEKGDEYLLKFDSDEGFELSTGSEMVGSRFLYAIGYNVPQYDVVTFTADKAQIDPAATIYDDTGFKKPLTRERFDKYLMFIPQDSEGRYRASAGKILKGVNKGYLPFQGRRRDDPADKIDHDRLRVIRGLRVFASWLNLYDIREGNTLVMEVEEDGRKALKHYLIDFNDTLGAAFGGAKPPMFTYEHMLDYGDMTKGYLTLGWWERTWQKKWRESGGMVQAEPAVGYFDSRYVQPKTYKTQLPHYAMKDLTRADGFWAAKILMSFTDDDIKAVVKAGRYSNPEDEAAIVKVLSERRDLVARCWYGLANPLDDFVLSGGRLSFKNLSVEAGFEPQDAVSYTAEVRSVQGKKTKKLGEVSSQENALDLAAYASQPDLDVKIRKGSGKKAPWVLVQIRGGKIAGVRHQD